MLKIKEFISWCLIYRFSCYWSKEFRRAFVTYLTFLHLFNGPNRGKKLLYRSQGGDL